MCPSELFVEQPFSVLVNPMDPENVFAKSIPIVLTFAIAALCSTSDDLSSHCGTKPMGGDHSIKKPYTEAVSGKFSTFWARRRWKSRS